MASDRVFRDDPRFPPPSTSSTVEGFIAHVYCEGARWHVLGWDCHGAFCSEPKCVINHYHALAKKDGGTE